MRRIVSLKLRHHTLAYVLLRPGQSATEAELRETARQHLNDLKVPEQILFLAEMPKGLTGKVDRRALKEMAHRE